MTLQVHRNYSINIHELLGKCTKSCEWKSQCKMRACTIHGMTAQILGGIRGAVDDDVSCSDYINERLILGRGALAHLKLTKIGYEYDAHISLDVDGVLKVNIPHHNVQRQVLAA